MSKDYIYCPNLEEALAEEWLAMENECKRRKRRMSRGEAIHRMWTETLSEEIARLKRKGLSNPCRKRNCIPVEHDIIECKAWNTLL